MGLMPKRVKFRKSQRGRRLGTSFKGANLAFGEFGLKALENSYFTDRQIEAARVALMRNLKGGGKVWLRIFPDKPITKKPAETRMGKGKGMPDHWVAVRSGSRVRRRWQTKTSQYRYPRPALPGGPRVVGQRRQARQGKKGKGFHLQDSKKHSGNCGRQWRRLRRRGD